MRIIIPMAGMGSRMRPHSLTIPKPLIPVAGKPIVQRLVEDITRVCDEKIEEIAFVIGNFGEAVEAELIKIASELGAKGSIYYQTEPLGTAHAILCAKESMSGNTVVAFADTLFKAAFKLDASQDGIIWVHKVHDPSAFGVVKLDGNNVITDFVEKPETFVSDLAIIGVYYFKDGEYLRDELQYLLDNDIKEKGEYQLTNALENMKNKGTSFVTGKVDEWLDCGNKDATVHTNQRVLEFHRDDENLVSDSVELEHSQIIEPCYIGEHAIIKNAIIGPHVSIGAHTQVEGSVIRNSIIQRYSIVKNKLVENSMIGNHVNLKGKVDSVSVGDYTTQE